MNPVAVSAQHGTLIHPGGWGTMAIQRPVRVELEKLYVVNNKNYC